VPIKKQTLAEKRFMIKNFDQCVEVYNNWVNNNPTIAQPVDAAGIPAELPNEQEYWQPTTDIKALGSS
jgi:hypothetical protein